ncbi:ATP-binding protein [Lactiplantibacillus fabifermentans]|uniref:YhaN AAA domain-containing protein n=2 Tax=Lactiplantibacillus fabifermentans TaxID=483011 RepID=A0A0R2NSN4_9LACO|nr:AAA family ATPase [Lactiplantibacillus fabifermentans]ETY74436.1 membrane protein [Lactiplantibacillus fabifermentans T30PCM01]KRO28678.1 hypothetical protein DY78_GL002195 [Lactiplantibacillus fabifermentans DSM 21115]
MQIKRIEIAGFGQFVQQTFDFSAGLQVIYGENESGKSTLRAFILGMLFGFPTRRHLTARYEPKETTQYGGSMDLVVDGTTYRLTRLGDQPATLRNLTTQAEQPMSLLDHWLAPYDEMQYKQLFTFNQAELTALKTLSATDLNQQLQQVGTLGSAPWRATAAALRASADELYKPRGRKPELNQALQQYQAMTTQVAAARAQYPQYQQLQREIQQLQADQARQQRDLQATEQRQQTLANLRNQWPVYQQLQQLRPAAAAQPLSSAVVAQYEQLTQTQTELQHTLASARQQLTQQPVDTASQGVLGFYLQHQTEFTTLQGQLPQLQQALGQYQTLTQQVTTAQATYDQQTQAHPELVACLSPNKQAALDQLKTKLRAAATASTTAPGFTADWRLYAGGIGLVAGVVLPLGGFKWVLMLIGLGLLGWFGWNQLAVPNANNHDNLTDDLVAAGFAPNLDRTAALEKLDLVAALQRAQATITTAEQQAAAQASHVWQLLQAYDFAAAWIPVDQAQLVISVTRVTQFYEQIQQLQQTESMSGPDFAYAQRQVTQLTAQVREITDQLQQLAQSQQLADIDALAAAITQQAQQTANAASAEQLQRQLTAADQQALAQYTDITDLQAAIATQRQQQTTQQTQLTATTSALVTAQTQLQRLTEDGRYAELRQHQANQQTELTVMARQWVTRQLGAAWIDEALQTLTSQQLPAILTQATSYFAQLTRQRYNEISLDDDELVVHDAANLHFKLVELSTATKEQLYLALRLALIAKLGDQAQLPLMIDDGFVNFDDTRRQVAWQLLAKVAKQHQVLYFTNETAALTEMLATAVHHLT